MVNLLRKLFIKNYKDVNEPNVRVAHGRLASVFGIISNAILFGLKLAVGLLTQSVSIIADSVNNLSDYGNSTVTLVGFKMSSKPADKKHPFGHQRIEYISGLIVSIIIVALAVLLFYNSVQKIIGNEATSYDLFAFIVLGVAIVIKLVQAWVNFSISKIINSVALKATALDSLTDSIATTLLLVSAILSYFFHWNLDGYVGVVIALFVAFSGVKMIVETSNPLIGESTSIEEVKKITDEILSYKGVLGIHDLMAHNYGPTKIFMTVHVEVDSQVNVVESHELIDDIENDIRKKYNVELTIHMDPIDISNPETHRLKEKTIMVISQIDKDLTIHDFRVVHGKTHTNIIFDVVIPFEKKLDEEELLRLLKGPMNKDEKKKINIVLHVDHPFVEK